MRARQWGSDLGPGGEVLMVLFALKIVYPGAVFLNRGNHEDIDICRAYGFSAEVIEKYTTPEDGPGPGEHLFNQVCSNIVVMS
jgi:hypothetical protein